MQKPFGLAPTSKKFLKTCVITVAATASILGIAPVPAFSASNLTRVSSDELPRLEPEGTLDDLKLAITRELEWCRAQTQDATYTFGTRRVSRKTWCLKTGQKMLQIAEDSDDNAEFLARVRDEFDWYKSKGEDGAGTMRYTGYNFPLLEGSSTPTANYTWPIYGRPSDLVEVPSGSDTLWRRRLPDGSLGTYWTRSEIDQDGKLRGQGLELGYIASAFDAFILQVQGAGALITTDANGTRHRIILNYAGQNGLKYVSPRSVLQRQGVEARYLTIPGMRRYFSENPDKLMPTLLESGSYVFFRVDAEGPYGIDNILLTAGHSIAIDPKELPMGAFALVNSTRPLGQGDQVTGWKPFSRFTVSQDIGGAIRGAGRADIYWGETEYAEFAAGNMNQPGAIYFAVTKSDSRSDEDEVDGASDGLLEHQSPGQQPDQQRR